MYVPPVHTCACACLQPRMRLRMRSRMRTCIHLPIHPMPKSLWLFVCFSFHPAQTSVQSTVGWVASAALIDRPINSLAEALLRGIVSASSQQQKELFRKNSSFVAKEQLRKSCSLAVKQFRKNCFTVTSKLLTEAYEWSGTLTEGKASKILKESYEGLSLGRV